jgi:competence protein ComGF
MAGRKDKNTVDYFPHYVNHGKTLFIIESKFGLEGYAAWFKILEMLGKSENHYIDCRNTADWEFMCAKIQLMTVELKDVIDLLAKLNAINAKLWENKIIWSENFVKNIQDAYRRRNNKCMQLTEICKQLGIDNCINDDINTINDDINTQSKVKETKLNKIKEEIRILCNGKDELIFKNYDKWVDYLAKQHEVYLKENEYTYETLLSTLKKIGINKFCEAVNFSIESNYKKIYEQKEFPRKTTQAAKKDSDY